MSATTKRRGPNPYAEMQALAAIFGFVFLVCVVIWAAAWIGTTDGDESPPGFPPALIVELVIGTYTWPGAGATAAVVVLSVLVAAAVIGIVVAVALRKRREVDVDRAVKYLAQPRDLRRATTKGVAEIATRLDLDGIDPPGVLIGKTVRGETKLWGSWEDMHVDIWGPRTGKTATRAIPNIVAAPGPAVVTSNKRDVVDATRLSRMRRGRVWVFDPQAQAGEPASWYWDPLTYVGDSIVRAVKMTGRFSSINRPDHARSDAYFEPAAEDLIANMLLAASIEGLPITQVYTWLTRPTDDTPERILRARGHDMSADAVDNVIISPDRQRAGVYGTAAQIMSFLIAPGVTEWVTPGSNPNRPQFDYLSFVKEGADTLYLLSEETNKMAAPLVLALTAALAEAAENFGIASPGGRVDVPILFVLDEAANVCPWKALPDKYSHFGSRGIVMMTILQSWAQGAAAWGDTGMAKLWGAANVRVYGGGVLDTKFLGDLSSSSGIFEPEVKSTSHKVHDLWEKNVTNSSRSEPVLDVPDLASMPRGRAFVQYSGMKPALVRTIPWWEGPYADEIRASLARFEPGGTGGPLGPLDVDPTDPPVRLDKVA
ncbi:MAG: type IV secretory system conjugative DNA transfer family protein [Streptomycetaceae bacterium]|nr:type IV secretory system conjugative DNA transfer family protein [Streptomycetaceae bacterium]